MITVTAPDGFDLRKTADSGQAFRFTRTGPGSYRLLAGSRLLRLTQEEPCGPAVLDCSPAEYHAFWKTYFDLDTDYRSVSEQIPPEDRYLSQAARFGRGIRILRQDPWEMLVTFILSQRKNIPAIKKSVEKLCEAAGCPVTDSSGRKFSAFPRPAELARLSLDDLKACGLGYRARYIRQTAEDAASGKAPLDQWQSEPDDRLMEHLLSLSGVGNKVASCIMLFGFHRLNAFPRDVWILKVLKEHYQDSFDPAAYSPYAGIMQQYLFYYIRAEENGQIQIQP